jgi:hypothetical protein
LEGYLSPVVLSVDTSTFPCCSAVIEVPIATLLLQILDAFCSVTFLVIYLCSDFIPTIVDTYLRVFCWVPIVIGTFDYDCSVHCSFVGYGIDFVDACSAQCYHLMILTVTVVDSLLLLLVFF